MTPTASASPITLLTTTVDPVVSAPAAGGGSPAAAPGRGFQLLIEAAAQQQLGAQLGVTLQKALPAAPANTAAQPVDGGNVLPLTGLLLPSTTDQLALPKDATAKTASSKDDSPDAAQPTLNAAAIQLLWVPINIQAAPPLPTGSVGSSNVSTAVADSDGKGQGGGSAISGAIAAQVAGIGQNAAAKKADGSIAVGTAADTAALDNDPLPAKQVPGQTAKPNTDPLVAISSTDTKIDTALLNIAAAAKSTEGSNFAEVLKPETAAQASTVAPTAVLDTGRTQPSARPYADMNSASATATVSLPVGSNGWSDAVVDKVMWFSANQLSNAEIKLNPPDLGPLQVRISTQHDQASVIFTSPHAAVREALDQALPRLRDMLGGQGIQLSDASVGGQGASRQQQQQGGENRAPSQGFFGGDDSSDTPIAVTRVIGSRLASSAVDAYA